MRKPKPIPPMGVSIRRPLWREIALWFFSAVGFALSVVIVAIAFIEWLSGCGETYVDAKGERHAYECVFIPQKEIK